MAETGSFTSLLDLVDDHLSKTSIQASQSEDNQGGFSLQLPSLSGGQNGTLFETRFAPGQRLPIPRLSLSDNPITSVLAEQVANMLKAKERRQKEEERRKVEEEQCNIEVEKHKIESKLNKLAIQDDEDDSSNYVIDLTQAIKNPYNRESFTEKGKVLCSTNIAECKDCDEDEKKALTPEPLLPCTTDFSHMLKQKVRRAKCSAFGKVLISRYRPVAQVYCKTRIQHDIVRFNFQTQSPCDVIKEKRQQPSCYNMYYFDLCPELRD